MRIRGLGLATVVAVSAGVIAPVAVAETPDGGKVIVVGDSNTWSMSEKYMGDKSIDARLRDAGYDAEVNSSPGRSMKEEMPTSGRQAGGDYDNATKAVKRLAGENRDATWVMAVGVNDSANTSGDEKALGERIDGVMDAIGDDARVLWVTADVADKSGTPAAYSSKNAEAFNAALEDAAKEHDNLEVVDWEAEAEDSDHIDDGVHYTPSGYEKMIGVITDALKSSGDRDGSGSGDREDSGGGSGSGSGGLGSAIGGGSGSGRSGGSGGSGGSDRDADDGSGSGSDGSGSSDHDPDDDSDDDSGSGSCSGSSDDTVYPADSSKVRLTSPYGPRWGAFHYGVDLAGPNGTPIYAFADGKVIRAEDKGVQGFGGMVILEHEIDGEKIQTVYGHMDPGGVEVKEGEEVTAGEHIADIGNSGQSTGPHLHFEVVEGDRAKGGKKVDPAPWLEKVDKKLTGDGESGCSGSDRDSDDDSGSSGSRDSDRDSGSGSGSGKRGGGLGSAIDGGSGSSGGGSRSGSDDDSDDGDSGSDRGGQDDDSDGGSGSDDDS